MSDAPWSFGEARRHCQRASQLQQTAEDNLKAAFRDYAEKEEAYRKALALKILDKHAEGVAWSTAPDLARGDEHVAHLRRERDISEGVREALTQAAWRRAADRRDAQRFADWSQRRELAEAAV